MWFFKNDKNKDWASNLRYITSFDTVEDFWALYNHILPASKLGVGCDYSLFKGVDVGIMTVGIGNSVVNNASCCNEGRGLTHSPLLR